MKEILEKELKRLNKINDNIESKNMSLDKIDMINKNVAVMCEIVKEIEKFEEKSFLENLIKINDEINDSLGTMKRGDKDINDIWKKLL